MKRYDTGKISDNFEQATAFYDHVLDDGMRKRLAFNIAENMKGANKDLQTKAVSIQNYTTFVITAVLKGTNIWKFEQCCEVGRKQCV